MTEYEITINGYESGLTRRTVEQAFREQYGGPAVTITVSESSNE